jgi:hypothetical protein
MPGRNHLLTRLLLDENTLSAKAQLAGTGSAGPALMRMVASRAESAAQSVPLDARLPRRA